MLELHRHLIVIVAAIIIIFFFKQHKKKEMDEMKIFFVTIYTIVSCALHAPLFGCNRSSKFSFSFGQQQKKKCGQWVKPFIYIYIPKLAIWRRSTLGFDTKERELNVEHFANRVFTFRSQQRENRLGDDPSSKKCVCVSLSRSGMSDNKRISVWKGKMFVYVERLCVCNVRIEYFY